MFDPKLRVPDYYSTFSAAKDYTETMFLAGRSLQSRELNDVQARARYDSEVIGGALFKQGSILSGATINVDNFIAAIEPAKIFYSGQAISVSGKRIDLGKVGSCVVGVKVTTKIVTELEDPDLRDPSLGYSAFGEVGAIRVAKSGVWQLATEPVDEFSEFFPVWQFQDGVMQTQAVISPELQSTTDMIARYDLRSNGSYVSEGMNVSYLGETPTDYRFAVNEGVASVDGYMTFQQFAKKFTIPKAFEFGSVVAEPLTFRAPKPEIQYVTVNQIPAASSTVSLVLDSVPYNFTVDSTPTVSEILSALVIAINSNANARCVATFNAAQNRMELTAKDTEFNLALSAPANFTFALGQANVSKYYSLRHDNIRNVSRVLGIKEVTSTVTHGNYQGCTDNLPNTPVVQILSVTQGGVTFNVNNDFIQVGDALSWSPAGAEPASGSTYTVKYRYQDLVPATVSTDLLKIMVEGFAEGTLFNVDYTYFLSFVDRVVLQKDGTVEVLHGAPDYYNPRPPVKPSYGLVLAQIYFAYGKVPVVTQDFVKAFKMSDIQSLQNAVDEVKYNMLQLSLKDAARATDPTTNKLNLFVDSFANESLRDLGSPNTADMVNGQLIPNITWNVVSTGGSGTAVLPAMDILVLDQPNQTTARKVNEYFNQKLTAIPVSVTPQNFRWVAGNNTVEVKLGSGGQRYLSNTTSSTVDTSATYPVPPTPLTITGSQFNFGELVDIEFDGTVIKTVNASPTGDVSTVITTPPNTMSGNKLIKVKGRVSGVFGEAIFTAQPQVNSTTYYWQWFDPVAQIIRMKNSGFYQKVQVVFAVKPESTAVVHITETQAGMPLRTRSLAKKLIQPSEITPNIWHSVIFDQAVFLQSNVDYAIVIESSDSTGAVKVAKIGQYDSTQGKWITSQSYADGVLLNSSTGATWNPIQDEDLTLKVFQKQFSESTTGVLGAVSVVDCTDLVLMTSVETYPRTFVSFTATLLDRPGESYVITPYVSVIVPQYTGRVRIDYVLSSTDNAVTPRVDLSAQVAYGLTDLQSTYTSRAFVASGSNLKVFLNIAESTAASVHVFAKNAAGNWVEMVRDQGNSKLLDNSLVEMPFVATGLGALNTTQIQIVLSTTDRTKRSYAENLRAYVY